MAQPPLNLQVDELLSAVAERLLKAMREIHPQTVRQFFALANQHMRWALNDLARRLDEGPAAVELREESVPAPASSGSGLTANGRRMLEAIEELPDDEREAFGLVRVQGMTPTEAARVLGVAAVTVKGRGGSGCRQISTAAQRGVHLRDVMNVLTGDDPQRLPCTRIFVLNEAHDSTTMVSEPISERCYSISGRSSTIFLACGPTAWRAE